MSTERVIAATSSSNAVVSGAVLQVVGLGLDGWLHARDPGLAGREGPFSLTNGGHALFAAGLALSLAGLALPALLRWRPEGVSRHVAAPLVLGVVLAVAAGAGAGLAGGHDHTGIDDPGVSAARARAGRILPGLGHDHSAVADQPLDPSTRQRLGAQLAVARTAALRYPTVADAEAAGYRMATPYVPLVGAHYVRFDVFTGDFDLEHPAILLFDGTGPEARTVGVSYYVSGPEPPEGFAGPNDHWHRHRALCVNEDGVVVGGDLLSEARCRGLGGRRLDGTDGWMLHAWVVPGWDSPQGVFSTENDDLR